MLDLKSLKVEELHQLSANIDAEIASRTGVAITVCDRDGVYEIPSGGALLHVTWAVQDRSYVEWYPTEDAAMAELHRLAGKRRVEGRTVDLTVAWCNYSGACVEVRS